MEEIKNQNLSELAAKNSVYSLMSVLILKLGGLIFTIIIARLLLPELFGIYALVLSVVAIATTFSDLGIDSTFIRYVSNALGKNKYEKTRAYFRYLFKIKLLLVTSTIFILILISRYLAYEIFNKPAVFLPLLFACFYIFIEALRSLFASFFTVTKDLKPTPLLELSMQLSKILFSLLLIILLADQFKIAGVFVVFGISSFVYLLSSLIIIVKKDKKLIFGKTESIEKPRVLNYLGFMGIASLSLVFFASIDTLMLGRFVEAAYIGHYRVALSLIVTIAAILSISGVLFPIFVQISKKRLERGFQKTFRYIMMFSIPSFFGVILTTKYVIYVIYGPEYYQAAPVLYALSLLILTAPVISLYSTLYAAKEKAKHLAEFIFLALMINIILNYFLIKIFITNQQHVIIAVAFATLISRIFLLILLHLKAKTFIKIDLKKSSLSKFFFASIIMSVFLITFNYFVDLNLFLGIIEIILGVLIYFGVLLLIQGITKEDIKIVKNLKPKNLIKD